MQHARQLHVVDEAAVAADEARVLLAQHAPVTARLLVVVDGVEQLGGGVDGGHDGAFSVTGCSAAQRMDRTMVV
ncbi:hypothetical protein GCM10022140_15020 [Rhodococcus aetherivorans]